MEAECFVQPSRVNDWWDLSGFANFTAMFYRLFVSNGFKNYTNIAQSEKSVSKNKWKKKNQRWWKIPVCFGAISNCS